MRFATLFSLTAALCLPVAAQPPNFIIILADDLGYGDVGAFRPGADVRTPHLDRLAADGVRFTGMRANCTVCSPSRAALLTGRFPDRVGVPGVIRTAPANSWGHLAPGVPTLGDLLHPAGYHTAIIGKWHLGLEAPNVPNDRGFDFFHGFLGDMMDSYTTHLRHGNNYLRRNREVITPTGHATDLFTSWTCDHLRARAADGKPFFLYLAYNAPHSPIEPPADWLARVKERNPGLPAARAATVALVEHMDDGIGRVLATLRETGLERNTLVAFSSDNGGSLPHANNNDPWRDGKQSHYDGGLRVPFIVRWPGAAPGGAVSEGVVSHIDVVPTLLDYFGIPVPDLLQGRSLLAQMRDPAHRTNEAVFVEFNRFEIDHDGFGAFAPIRCVFDGRRKLVINLLDTDEFYDLREDPLEMSNRISDAAGAGDRERLLDALLAWMNRTRDPLRGPHWARRHWGSREGSTWGGPTRPRPFDEAYYPKTLLYDTGKVIDRYEYAKH
ncbi:MAG: N-acetylgalactosamine 6-sulfate sulfatase [Planctomycetia bacterium]|nr:N-acetylgalactosamine 6-sulfate sulfatase [Planctomycetia bacterium]